MQLKIKLQLSFRVPLDVTETIVYINNDSFPVCPRCKATLEREYVSFCDRCGQKLNWSSYSNADIIYRE